ncbi:NAD-dependent epimerase/dehydratase family protein [bacterium]|nr:NAD-dependent epimerase/dehydratase family protein [bacterium]
MSVRILVTGSTGFVGSHLAESLLADGCIVRLLVRDPRKLRWFDRNKYEIIVGDLTDSAVLSSAVESVDIVIHCAGVTKAVDIGEYYRINKDATQLLAEVSEQQGVNRFVYCSTLAVCGPSKNVPHREEDEVSPITNYGRSKFEGELALKRVLRNTSWQILRPPAVMGPRDEQFVPLFKMMWRWRVFTDVGGHPRKYSMIGVHDLVRALKLSAFSPVTNDTFFVGMSLPYEWRDVAHAFSNVCGRRPRRVVVPAFVSRIIGVFGDYSMRISRKPVLLNSEKVKEILAESWMCSVSKAESVLGFQCKDDLESVVRKTFEFYRQRNWI